MPRRITLRDIADKAEVHLSTVSLALRNSPKLRKETREFVQKIADQLGYVPDAALSALVIHRKGVRASSYQSTLAWLDNWTTPGNRLRDIPTFNANFQGALARADQLGYKLEEFSLRSPGIPPARMASILKSRNIKGILVAPQEHDGVPFPFDFTDFAAVTFGYSLQPACIHVVTNHQFRSMQLLVAKLHELGYRRIGLYLAHDWDKKVNQGYTAGFLAAHAAIGGRKPIPPCLWNQLQPASFKSWITRHRPDAIITQGISKVLIGWLKSFGLCVPEDIAVTSLSAHSGEPDIAGIYQNDRLIGATAIDIVTGMLQRNERGLPQTILYTLVEGTWHPGSSVQVQKIPSANFNGKPGRTSS